MQHVNEQLLNEFELSIAKLKIQVSVSRARFWHDVLQIFNFMQKSIDFVRIRNHVFGTIFYKIFIIWKFYAKTHRDSISS